MQWSAVTWRSANPARQGPEHRWYHKGRTAGVQQDVASGAAGGFIGRQPVTASTTSTETGMSDFESDSALSDALGTETLAARSMIPDDYRQPPDADTSQSFVWIEGRQFLKAEHAANIRSGMGLNTVSQATLHKSSGVATTVRSG
ncbi:MAG: hypothetical protein AUG51_18285 [Acidobacteria bacterium 13_1_20CM_3_53_8]|nr:MAG: hypothetical protein AUG51_18285 [Acidobacteria bacterium 13_1_20CM_3_53_8]